MGQSHARRLRNHATRHERLLWRRLKRFRALGFHIRRQAPIGPYIADFACHAERLIVEIDGDSHGEPGAAQRDARRAAWLESQGYRVLRFTNN